MTLSQAQSPLNTHMQIIMYSIVNTGTEEIVATSTDLELIRQTVTLIELDSPDDDFEIQHIPITVRIP